MVNSNNKSLPYSTFSFSFIKAYSILLRPYLMFISGLAGLLGLCLSEEKLSMMYIPPFIAFFFTYGFGQALTDSFQTDTDAISSPYRPLVRGEITPSQVFRVSLVGLLLCILVLMYYNVHIFAVGTLGALGLIAYTPFKKRWWGGPWWNSWIVALLVILGKMVFVKDFSLIYNVQLLYACLAIFFAYSVFVLIGYLKDISADEATGYITLPVKFGWNVTVITGIVHFALALFFGILLIFTSTQISFSYMPIQFTVILILVFTSGLFYIYSHIQLFTMHNEKRAYSPIIFTVRCFLLLTVSIILSFNFILLTPLIIFYLLFEISMYYRPEKTQV